MKKKVRVLLLLCMLALSLGGTAVAGHAAEDDTTMTAVRAKKTGWVKEGKWYFYYGPLKIFRICYIRIRS